MKKIIIALLIMGGVQPAVAAMTNSNGIPTGAGCRPRTLVYCSTLQSVSCVLNADQLATSPYTSPNVIRDGRIVWNTGCTDSFTGTELREANGDPFNGKVSQFQMGSITGVCVYFADSKNFFLAIPFQQLANDYENAENGIPNDFFMWDAVDMSMGEYQDGPYQYCGIPAQNKIGINYVDLEIEYMDAPSVIAPARHTTWSQWAHNNHYANCAEHTLTSAECAKIYGEDANIATGKCCCTQPTGPYASIDTKYISSYPENNKNYCSISDYGNQTFSDESGTFTLQNICHYKWL